jgi:hypothetical protein
VWGSTNPDSSFTGPYSSRGRITCTRVLEAGIHEPQFRLDSRLLVLSGDLDEDKRGVAYYVWTGSGLRELRFYPSDKLCRASLKKPGSPVPRG